MKLLHHVVIGCLMLVMVPVAWASDSVGPQKETTEWKQDSYDHLRKIIGLTRFQNRSVLLDDRLVTTVDEILTGTLTKSCKTIVPIRNADQAFNELRDRQPRHVSGNIDNMSLIQVGRADGMNAVVSGTIMEIRHFQEERGYWWFAKMINFIEVHIQCDVYDTETGAKLLDVTLSEKTDLSEELYQQVEAGDFADAFPAIENLAKTISEKLAEEICDNMEDEPFKTFVKTIDGNQVTVSTGSDGGLKPGDLLAIHDSGTVIIGKDEHKFFLAGKQTGILRIDAVQETAAQGTIVQGKMTGRDDCLKPIVEQSFLQGLFSGS